MGQGLHLLAYLAERLDDDGNVVGSVSVSAGASLDAGNQQVSYWGSAYSSVSGCDENQMPHTGMANAWVKVPGKRQHMTPGPWRFP